MDADTMNAAVAALTGVQETPPDAPPQETETPPATPQSQVATPEPPKADEPPPDPQEQRLSKSWAAISKREAAIRNESRAIEEQRAALSAAQAELVELRKLRENLVADPVAVLDAHAGKDWYQKATQRFIESPTGSATPDSRIAQLEKALDDERKGRDEWFDKQWQARETKRSELTSAQQQAEQYTSKLRQLVETDDRFELTRITPNGIQAVIDIVNAHLQQSKVLLEPEDAATLIEEELEKQYQALSGAKKIAIAAKPAQKQDATQTAPKAPSGPPKTLTDNMSASGTPAHQQTEAEEIREAAKLYRRLLREHA